MEVTVRPYTDPDHGAVVGLLQRTLTRDPISRERFTRQVLLDPNFHPEGAVSACDEQGQVAGFCLAIARQVPLENAPPDDDRGYITLIGVCPEHQRRGIGGRLLAAAEDYLRGQGRRSVLVSPYAPGYFIPGVDVDAYAGALPFFRKHGYREVYRPLAMEAPLWDLTRSGWLEHRETGQDVRVEAYRDEDTLPLLEFVRREFPGDWVRVVREVMTRITAGECPRRRLLIACRGREILGFVHHDRERFGPIGVARPERGCGIGHRLMFEALAAIREQGFRTAWFLWSDDNTARRLYEAAGFREIRRFAILRKDL
jgi:mycothiol synthase